MSKGEILGGIACIGGGLAAWLYFQPKLPCELFKPQKNDCSDIIYAINHPQNCIIDPILKKIDFGQWINLEQWFNDCMAWEDGQRIQMIMDRFDRCEFNDVMFSNIKIRESMSGVSSYQEYLDKYQLDYGEWYFEVKSGSWLEPRFWAPAQKEGWVTKDYEWVPPINPTQDFLTLGIQSIPYDLLSTIRGLEWDTRWMGLCAYHKAVIALAQVLTQAVKTFDYITGMPTKYYDLFEQKIGGK